MKKIIALNIMILCFAFGTPLSAVVVPANENKTSVAVEEEKAAAKEHWKSLSKKEKRAKKKELRKALKKAKADGASSDTLLLVLIGIFIPPLAMALYDGITNRFWISLLLTILFFVPGLIYTLVVILKGN